MIRDELLHPAISHFPIACLSLSLLVFVAYLMTKKTPLKTIFEFLLFTGSALILPTLFLGDMALDIVKPELCSLIEASKHEIWGEYTLVFAILTSAIWLSQNFLKRGHTIIKYLTLFSLITCNYWLFKTAHEGGELVYDLGAAVKIDKNKCSL